METSCQIDRHGRKGCKGCKGGNGYKAVKMEMIIKL